MRIPESAIRRFRSRVDSSAGPDGCWPWTGRRNTKNHYGVIDILAIKRAPVLAHRVSWAVAHGGEMPPDALHVLHRCDNPPCVNPNHLFLGTDADNVADMDAKGRRRAVGLVGTDHHQAKITEADVLEIDRLSASGLSHRQIAPQFGITATMVGYILRRQNWKHVPKKEPGHAA